MEAHQEASCLGPGGHPVFPQVMKRVGAGKRMASLLAHVAALAERNHCCRNGIIAIGATNEKQSPLLIVPSLAMAGWVAAVRRPVACLRLWPYLSLSLSRARARARGEHPPAPPRSTQETRT